MVRKKIAEQMMKKSAIAIKRPTHPIFSKICNFIPCPVTTHPIFSKICNFFPCPVTPTQFFQKYKLSTKMLCWLEFCYLATKAFFIFKRMIKLFIFIFHFCFKHLNIWNIDADIDNRSVHYCLLYHCLSILFCAEL